jgi:spore germination protein KA
MYSPEDYGLDALSSGVIRILRYGALLLSLLLPGFYLALTVFHQEMIPLPLLRSIIEARAAVPFSTSGEVMGLLLAFELLQEAGIHLPKSIGQSVSIIGGIVVGTAAVEAGLISPAALIVVSLAGICGFALPNRDFAEAVRMCRFGLAFLGAKAGLFGLCVGGIGLMIHLSKVESLGEPYLAPFSQMSNAGILRTGPKEEID